MGSDWPSFCFFLEYVRVSKGRSGLQDIIQVVLIFATTVEIAPESCAV